MAGAVILRIAFAAVTVQLLAIVGLTLAGGILLLWVCWKMYRELVRKPHGAHGDAAGNGRRGAAPMSFRAAVTQIVIADLSMSLDNVLAVAGAAKGSGWVLVIGLLRGHRADGDRGEFHRRHARALSLDHVDRPLDHRLGGARHDLRRLARGRLRRLEGRVVRARPAEPDQRPHALTGDRYGGRPRISVVRQAHHWVGGNLAVPAILALSLSKGGRA